MFLYKIKNCDNYHTFVSKNFKNAAVLDYFLILVHVKQQKKDSFETNPLMAM